ncbi:hypothetical protein F3Y22_tig00110372pilonHSYRG00059 [Hibiscus syriacus]|uniref:Uncharacterized protein n=1 Tax=Hibiscus syriacus TaxID=106335 RepID=A0A6A3AWN1_HIBSY|nr:hypothetical protein F3Y22_tig00110372pilonHSYRG00059 [Hibiscus syriacus]
MTLFSNGYNLSNLPYESEHIWPLPGLMQRAQAFQQASSSMANNLTSRTSPTSILNSHIEPPSNQSIKETVHAYSREYKTMLQEPLFAANILPLFIPSMDKLKLLQVAMAAHLISNSEP